MVSKSTEYYHSHPEARERKKSYDTKFESSPAQKHWQEAVENLGGKYLIVRSLDEFIKVVEE